MVLTYNGTLPSYKKERKNAVCSNMDGPRDHLIILNEVSQTEKDRYHIIPNMWESKTVMQMNLFIKLKHTHSPRKQTYGYQRGKDRRDKLGVWD